jgi:uncharacterized membrane protein YheB (UPF0754 family)
MPNTPQSAQSHAAWTPIFHFIAAPITMIAFFNFAVIAFKDPTRTNLIWAVYSFGITVGVFASRVMAVRVQDRLIRLEMRLHLKEILPAALFARFPELTVKQLIALRFASDAEMAALVERTLKGEFGGQKEIKLAIKDWQSDYLRA